MKVVAILLNFFIAWIWSLVTAATYEEKPMQVHIVHTNANGQVIDPPSGYR